MFKHFRSGARVAGPIGKSERSFDVPERRKDDGANYGSIGCTWLVPRAIAQTLAKINRNALQARPVHRRRNVFGQEGGSTPSQGRIEEIFKTGTIYHWDPPCIYLFF